MNRAAIVACSVIAPPTTHQPGKTERSRARSARRRPTTSAGTLRPGRAHAFDRGVDDRARIDHGLPIEVDAGVQHANPEMRSRAVRPTEVAVVVAADLDLDVSVVALAVRVPGAGFGELDQRRRPECTMIGAPCDVPCHE